MGIKILSLSINKVEPFQSVVVVPFHPGVTIIRGENGAGKTTILESLALFGHLSEMQYGSSDVAPFIGPEIQVLVELEKVSYDASIAANLGTVSPGRLVVCMQYIGSLNIGQSNVPDLKNFLGNEDSIRRDWRVRAGSQVNKLEVQRLENIRSMFAFSRRDTRNLSENVSNLTATKVESAVNELNSRLSGVHDGPAVVGSQDSITDTGLDSSQPKMEEFAHFCKRINTVIDKEVSDYCLGLGFGFSERSKHLANCADRTKGDNDSLLPPFAAYVNTDMYEWGVGLDVRESPKSLPEDLPPLLRRLGLTRGNGKISNFDAVKFLWNKMLDQGRRLECICIQNQKAHIWLSDFDSRNSDSVRDAALSQDVCDTSAPNACPHCIEPNRAATKPSVYDVQFLSSGENQVLTLSLLIGGLRAEGSCLFLDEPDLHLDLRTAKRFYLSLFGSAQAHNNQYVVVTHLPLIFANDVCEPSALKECLVDTSSNRPLRVAFETFLRDRNKEPQLGLVYLVNSASQSDKQLPPLLSGSKAVKAVAEMYRDELRFVASQAEFPETSIPHA